MTRSFDFSSRFAAFAASLLLASLTLAASVGPAFVSMPIA